MLLKPVKRGMKMWMCCNSKTGYTYDMNVYGDRKEGPVAGIFAGRVVRKLVVSIRESDVSLAFDRFFTSVNLIRSVNLAAVGTLIKTKRKIPTFEKKLVCGDAESKCTKSGLLALKWLDTKEVHVLRNCHFQNMGEVLKKQKDESLLAVGFHEAIITNRKCMEGVDLADRLAGLCELDWKSQK